jgi:hypothetical protein
MLTHEQGAVAFGPLGLTSSCRPCTLNKLPWIGPRYVVCDGVCLFFENSTVCRMLVPCLFCVVLGFC